MENEKFGKKEAVRYLEENLRACQEQKQKIVDEVYAIVNTEETLAKRRILFSEIDETTGQIQAYLVALRMVSKIEEAV